MRRHTGVLLGLALCTGLLAGCDDNPPADPMLIWVRDLPLPSYLSPIMRAAWDRATARGARERDVLQPPEGSVETDESAALLWDAEREATAWVAAHGVRPFPGRDNVVRVESPMRIIHARDLAAFVANRGVTTDE